MKKPSQNLDRSVKPIGGADLGRYLKKLAEINKDPQTGNPALSKALMDLANDLLKSNSRSPSPQRQSAAPQEDLDFEKHVEYKSLSVEAVRKLLTEDGLNKPQLLALSSERFGMPKSRLKKLPRNELLSAIFAALQHEDSLTIISEEARRGGLLRSS